MTDTEDDLLDTLNGQAKLTLLWQLLAGFTSYLLTPQQPWFWIPVTCAALAVVLSAVELLWNLPRLRRAVWESAIPASGWVDAPYETHCYKIDPKTGEFVSKLSRSEEETREFFQPESR